MSLALAALRGARQHGSSSVVFVSGPSGIGKTALLSEICRQAVAMKFRVASSKCDPIEQVWPGAPVIAMLRGGRDPLATAAEYEDITQLISEPLVLAERIAARLEESAMTGALLIGIDDLQWADRVSRFVLRMLLSRLTGLPAVWVLASRDASPGDLGPDLAGHAGLRVEHIRLPPLAATDLAVIAHDRLGHAPDERTRQFLDAAGGNPFLATQIIDGLAHPADLGEPETVPVEFTAAVARRVAALTGSSRDLLDLLAVAGRPLQMRDAAALMTDTDDPGRARAAADAVESGLINASGDILSFRHDLVREAVYACVPRARGLQLHRMFAEYNLTPPGDPLIAAWHARAAATPGDLAGARILISAAETLAPISSDDAGDLAALAFRMTHPAQPEWLELSLRCLSVLRRTQRAAEAIAVADQILARSEDGNVIGQVETEAARALWLSGRISELDSRAERVLKITGLDASVTAQLRAARALAGTRLSAGDKATQDAAAALEYARETDNPEALALALQAAGEAATNQARHQAALRHFRELRSHTGLSWLAEEITALQFLDRYDHAQALLNQARADSRSATQAMLPALNYAQAWQDFTLGRLDDADAGAQTLIELGQQLGNGIYTLDAIVIRVAVSLLRGDTEIAAAQLRRANGLSGADDSVRRVGLAVANGWLAAARGSIEQALGALRPVVEGARQSRSYWPLWPCWNGLFFEFATLAGDQEFCAACVDIAEITAARNPGVASFEGIALNVRGRSLKDLDIIAQSAEVLGRSPRPVLRAFGADSYGRALLTAGRRSDGLAWLDRAWDEYHQMGAWASRADVQHAMREAGARKPKWSAATRKPATGWPSLTEAERRVATLIGSGHTNKSAAAELGVSVNTVGTHLRAVFGKLGIQSRVQLANELHKEELI
jgi:DNA-binding CsgD family transcriptional regulator/tetratricopeptide (TPR) repeat protein